MLYIIELNALAYITFGSTDNVINDVTNDVIRLNNEGFSC